LGVGRRSFQARLIRGFARSSLSVSSNLPSRQWKENAVANVEAGREMSGGRPPPQILIWFFVGPTPEWADFETASARSEHVVRHLGRTAVSGQCVDCRRFCRTCSPSIPRDYAPSVGPPSCQSKRPPGIYPTLTGTLITLLGFCNCKYHLRLRDAKPVATSDKKSKNQNLLPLKHSPPTRCRRS